VPVFFVVVRTLFKPKKDKEMAESAQPAGTLALDNDGKDQHV